MTVVASAAFAVAVLAALAQAVTGFGSALLAVPLLTIVVGPHAAVVSVTALSAALSAYAVVRERRHVAWNAVVPTSVAALVGMPLGLLALLWLDTRTLTMFMGLVLLAFVVVLVRGVRLPRSRTVDVGAGFLSGGLLTSTGVNGPPLVAAFQAMDLERATYRATLLAILCVQDLIAVSGFGLLGQITPVCLVVIGAGLPGMALGWAVGDRLFSRFAAGQFRRVVLVMLTLSACVAIGQAVISR